ncbi:Ni/Fe-hydrogenase, b-type cytochrome subunit [Salmonella enterica]|nr:Ni/Fe-hydrogenase, b-type cytochrome subunit [Salmonella enterica]
MLLIIMEGSWSGFRYDDDDSEVSMHLKEITSQGYYIYEAPVRLWHWITALSIVVLAVTGYFIGRPLPSIQGEATFMFWMGWIRLIHFTRAYIFTVALLFRIYWACVGNEYAREMFLVPFWRRAWRKGVISEIRWYFFLEKEAHRYYGHNPVAGLAVMFYFWMSVLMVCSGFALYGEGLGTDSWAYQWFGWMIRLTGNDSLALHFWHRLGMWFIIAFVIAHVYTAIREDIMSRQSVISVMISGWRWFR